MATRKKPPKSRTPAKAKAAAGGKRRGGASAIHPAEARAKDKAAPAHLFDSPRNVKRLIYVLYAVCGVSLLLDFVIHRHVDHPWESFFGFYAVYGLVGFVVLVLAAKQLRKVLMRRESYYDD